ncbi:hypothetical protein AgCh_026881 [Apium graveolens]
MKMNKMNNDSEKLDDTKMNTKMKMDQISRWPRPSILEKVEHEDEDARLLSTRSPSSSTRDSVSNLSVTLDASKESFNLEREKAAWRVRPGVKFFDYALLGDYIVIADPVVAKSYLEVMEGCKVTITKEKSLISNEEHLSLGQKVGMHVWHALYAPVWEDEEIVRETRLIGRPGLP